MCFIPCGRSRNKVLFLLWVLLSGEDGSAGKNRKSILLPSGISVIGEHGAWLPWEPWWSALRTGAKCINDRDEASWRPRGSALRAVLRITHQISVSLQGRAFMPFSLFLFRFAKIRIHSLFQYLFPFAIPFGEPYSTPVPHCPTSKNHDQNP